MRLWILGPAQHNGRRAADDHGGERLQHADNHQLGEDQRSWQAPPPSPT
jgi:hypothetical protein